MNWKFWRKQPRVVIHGNIDIVVNIGKPEVKPKK
jgi:hypothetical protein